MSENVHKLYPRVPPPTASSTSSASAAGPGIRRIKKGELVFAEGDTSSSMYFVKVGMIRIYKKKGDSDIEIDTIRAGSILGELAFLDGNPRSASAEALTDCELAEISASIFHSVLVKMPDWLKILLRTVVSRLRAASTRIKQLETASAAYDYADRDGRKAPHYVYLSALDVLKILSAFLLAVSRHGKTTEAGTLVKISTVLKYGNQIMGVPEAKIATIQDILLQAGVLSAGPVYDQVLMKEADFLEQLIAYLNEENLVEPTKRHDISLRGFIVMNAIAKHLHEYSKDKSGDTIVNIAAIKSQESEILGKELFRMDEFVELVKLGYCSALNVKSGTEQTTSLDSDQFYKHYRFQKVAMMIQAQNEQKRKRS